MPSEVVVKSVMMSVRRWTESAKQAKRESAVQAVLGTQKNPPLHRMSSETPGAADALGHCTMNSGDDESAKTAAG